jgi:hypothetical protein
MDLVDTIRLTEKIAHHVSVHVIIPVLSFQKIYSENSIIETERFSGVRYLTEVKIFVWVNSVFRIL